MVFISVPDSETEQLEAYKDWNVLFSHFSPVLDTGRNQWPVVHPCIDKSMAGVRFKKNQWLVYEHLAIHIWTRSIRLFMPVLNRVPQLVSFVARARACTLSSTTTVLVLI